MESYTRTTLSECADLAEELNLPVETVIQASIALSLNRIAEKLDASETTEALENIAKALEQLAPNETQHAIERLIDNQRER